MVGSEPLVDPVEQEGLVTEETELEELAVLEELLEQCLSEVLSATFL